MTPSGKLVIGVLASGVVAAAAHTLSRAPLLSDLGSRSAGVMADNGVTDGRTDWVSDAGLTHRIARISGTADAATRARTLAGVAALDGVHDAVWVDNPRYGQPARIARGDCRRSVGSILAARPVGFADGGHALAAGSDRVIDALAAALQACPTARVEVIGHTAAVGNSLFTLALSQARAEAVANALARRGIDPRNLEPIGLGATSNDAPDGIELRIRHHTSAGTGT